MSNIFTLNKIFGTYEFSVDNVEKTLNILHSSGIVAEKIKLDDNSTLHLRVRASRYKKVASLLDKSGIKVYSIRGEGLPFFIKRYRKRYGIAVGALLFCAILFLSKLFVWEVRFSGNENISDEVLEQMLQEAGFGVGTYIPSIDFYTLCNDFLRTRDEFSFVSVNMEGTSAHVEIRERKQYEKEENFAASNLVAKFSGQIDSMTVYSGKSVIASGDVVKEGDLLVSGFLEKKFGFDVVRSTGSVYAYVTRIFELEVPFEKEIEVYSGREQKNVSLYVFGKTFYLYEGIDGTLGKGYERVDKERLVLFDRVRLPLYLQTLYYSEYEKSYTTLTEETAREEAARKMSVLLGEELGNDELLERTDNFEVTDTGVKLVTKVYCLTDIALEKEIKIN